MATLPDIMDEKLIGDNPRDGLVIRLQSLQMNRKAERQRIKELKKQVKKNEKESKELERLNEYKISYVNIFDRLCEKYFGFPPNKILAGGKDVKEIEVLQEIITARAKRNLKIGLAVAALIPIVGWLTILFSFFEKPCFQKDPVDDAIINLPVIFFRLKNKIQKGGVNASSLITEKYRYSRLGNG